MGHCPVRNILPSFKTSHPVTLKLNLLNQPVQCQSVIPVLEDVYDTFRNLIQQKSDSRPPFNSKEMENFTKNRNIEQVKTPPGHSFPNNLETVMKPLCKTMKIGQF